MPNQLKMVILMLIVLISACDNKPAKSKLEKPVAGQVKALEKAKDVEKKLLEGQQKTLEALEKATN